MKRYLIPFLLTLLCACGTNPPEAPNPDDVYKNIIDIDFANAQIALPDRYKKLSFFQFESLILSSEFPEYAENIVKNYKLMDMQGIDYVICADTNRFFESVLINEIKGVDINRGTASQLMSLYDDYFKQNWRALGIQFERLEGKFMSNENASVIKLKFKVEGPANIIYFTQYVVSANKKTISFVVNSLSHNDFQENILSIKL